MSTTGQLGSVGTTGAVRRPCGLPLAVGCLAALLSLLAPSPVAAGILLAPDFPISPAHPETAGALMALRYQTTTVAQSVNLVQAKGQNQFDVPRSAELVGLDFAASSKVQPELVAPIYSGAGAYAFVGGVQALNTMGARATVQVIKEGSATASVTLSMMDLVTVTREGFFLPSLKLEGTATQEISPEPGLFPSAAGSRALADLYIWEYGVGGLNRNPPTEGTPFFFPYHESWSLTPTGLAKTSIPEELPEFREGSKWWVAAFLYANATARTSSRFVFQADTDLEAEVAALDTLTIRLDPSPLTPNASYTTASGIDYRSQTDLPPGGTAPEPGTLALLGLGLAGLAAARRRKQ